MWITYPKRNDFFTRQPNEHWGSEVLMFMGFGLGQAIEDTEKNERRDEWTRHFYKSFRKEAKKIWVIQTGEYGDEPDQHSVSTTKLTFDELVSRLCGLMEEDYRRAKRRGYDPAEVPTTWKEVGTYLSESTGEWSTLIFFDTLKKFNQYEADKRRQELEEAAKSLASKYKVKVGSFEFIKAVRKEMRELDRQRESWNNPEARAERYAECSLMGIRDIFFEDNDFENGRFDTRGDTIDGIWEWLESSCPLLIAQYRERRLARKRR
jgi:preprotein translocase subunit SecE